MNEVSMIDGHIDRAECHILDSGDRTQFPSGAVRDMQKGKGRCDLMPLDIISQLLCSKTLSDLDKFQNSSDVDDLYATLNYFVEMHDEWNDLTDMILDVAKHFEEGAEKYGEDNWKKGLPVKNYINSAVRHFLKWVRNDQDEPHDRAFCWNIICAIWTCEHIPELNDYARGDVEC